MREGESSGKGKDKGKGRAMGLKAKGNQAKKRGGVAGGGDDAESGAATRVKKGGGAPPADDGALQADVAAFARKLGLAPAMSGPGLAPSAEDGFDDRDFRKTGPISKAPTSGSNEEGKSRGAQKSQKQQGLQQDSSREAKGQGGKNKGQGKGKVQDKGYPARGQANGNEAEGGGRGARGGNVKPLGTGLESGARVGPRGGAGEGEGEGEEGGERGEGGPFSLPPPPESNRSSPLTQALATLGQGKLSKIVDWQTQGAPAQQSLLDGPSRWYDVAHSLSASMEAQAGTAPVPAGNAASTPGSTQVSKKEKAGKRHKGVSSGGSPAGTPGQAGNGPQSMERVSEEVVGVMRERGDALIHAVADSYERRKKTDSDARWLETVRKSGTTADRVAALTVAVQDDPVASLRSLDALLGECSGFAWLV